MYKGKFELNNPNREASHITYNGFKKSYGMVNVIRYRGPSTSEFGLSAGFARDTTSCLSNIVK